jgi:hypothetical protein
MPTATSCKSKYVPKGVNDVIHFYCRLEAPVTMANADTLLVTLPDGVDPDALPVSITTFDPVGGGVRALNSALTITNHNPTTGVTTLTAGGAVPAGASVLLGFCGS